MLKEICSLKKDKKRRYWLSLCLYFYTGSEKKVYSQNEQTKVWRPHQYSPTQTPPQGVPPPNNFRIIYTSLISFLITMHFLLPICRTMKWTPLHNLVLCKKVILVNPYRQRKKYVQRSALQQQISDNLNAVTDPHFIVDKRSVRDNIDILIKRFKRQQAQELRESGTIPEWQSWVLQLGRS